jgi:hypothetical protein
MAEKLQDWGGYGLAIGLLVIGMAYVAYGDSKTVVPGLLTIVFSLATIRILAHNHLR